MRKFTTGTNRPMFFCEKMMLLIICALACLEIKAQITLPALFTDNMVLQQKSEVAVWGWGNAGETLKIVGSWLPKDTVKAEVASDGKWKAVLKTTQAGGPYTIQFMGSTNLSLQQVMLGEVWLCSGQSNMEWQPRMSLLNKDDEIKAAQHPNIRFFTVPKRGSDFPQDNCEGQWEVCTPETMSRSSSVAYFFGRRLQEILNVPVGLIISAWGGTPAEVWVPRELIEQNTLLEANKPQKTCPWWPIESGKLYNQMIHPLVSYRIAGSIWYQGESNHDRYSSYNLLMKELIGSWRKDFGYEFPFYFVQIAPHTYNAENNTPALLREQQERTSLEMPKTGMIVISDLVDNVKDIHPVNKQGVGLRLANMALANDYGQDMKYYQSPTLKSMTVSKNKVIVQFKNAENGLICKDKKIIGLKIAGEDGKWQDAEAKISGNTLIVFSPEVKVPVKVSYCFDDASIGNLFTNNGLPVAPFRTDRGF